MRNVHNVVSDVVERVQLSKPVRDRIETTDTPGRYIAIVKSRDRSVYLKFEVVVDEPDNSVVVEVLHSIGVSEQELQLFMDTLIDLFSREADEVSTDTESSTSTGRGAN